MALETARALEVRGDIAEAARWLRRAANDAEKQGNDSRVLAIAHAAADLSGASGQASVTKASVPKLPPRIDQQRDPLDSDPTLHWRATPPPLPAPASSLPTPAAPISFLRERAIVVPVAERNGRMGAIRVALKNPAPGAQSFSVVRLDANQPLPPGTVEAMLVLAGDV